jgi:hypothetical protein
MLILPMAISCLLRKLFFSSKESGSTSISMVILYKPLHLRRIFFFWLPFQIFMRREKYFW